MSPREAAIEKAMQVRLKELAAADTGIAALGDAVLRAVNETDDRFVARASFEDPICIYLKELAALEARRAAGNAAASEPSVRKAYALQLVRLGPSAAVLAALGG